MAMLQHAPVRPLSALDVIFTRRSIRAFTKQRVDRATIRALLDAAVQAPTAVHLQPWAFVIVEDQDALKRYSDRAKGRWAQEADAYRDLHAPTEVKASGFFERLADPEFSIFYGAPVLIAICARPMGTFVAADCWLAAENLMLAACAMGLGSCVIGSAVPALNAPDIKRELGIPDDVEIVAPIAVGVPAGAAAAVTRRDPHILHWK